MAYEDVLVHVATPLIRSEAGAWVEGEVLAADAAGTPFDCCLFLPSGEESTNPRSRQVTRPTLLIAPRDRAGNPVTVKAEDELLVLAPELNAMLGVAAGLPVRWMVQGTAQGFGRPGDDLIGGQLTLARVDD